MKNDKKSVLLYTEWAEPLKSLPLEEKGRIFDAILSYTENGRMPKFENPATDMAFRWIQQKLDEKSRSGKKQGLNVLRQERAAERQKVTQMQKNRNNQNNQMIVLIVRILKRTNSRRLQLVRPTESRSPTGYGLDAIRCSRLIWPQNSETCGKLV